MSNIYRIRLGSQNKHTATCRSDGYIGVHYGVVVDISDKLTDNVSEFNESFRPIYQAIFPDKSRMAASTIGGIMCRLACVMKEGDLVISPTLSGDFLVGEITGAYRYVEDAPLIHQRPVRWLDQTFTTDDVSEALLISLNSRGTIINLNDYHAEIIALLSGQSQQVSHDEQEHPVYSFALENHLEEFLVRNWSQTEFGRDYTIFEENGELGQQIRTDTGFIDLLAISHDRKTLLVVELKRGRTSDKVVGQVLRYIGYVRDELAEPSQTVKGVIIAREDNLGIRRSLSTLDNVEFYCYELSFQVKKVN